MPRAHPEQPERVRVDSLKPGPIRHERLSDKQIARLRRIHETFSEVDGFTYEERESSFTRDSDPDRELDIWEALASAYARFCDSRELSLDAKREVYGLLLRRSMCSAEEALRDANLKLLSPEVALEILRYMGS